MFSILDHNAENNYFHLINEEDNLSIILSEQPSAEDHTLMLSMCEGVERVFSMKLFGLTIEEVDLDKIRRAFTNIGLPVHGLRVSEQSYTEVLLMEIVEWSASTVEDEGIVVWYTRPSQQEKRIKILTMSYDDELNLIVECNTDYMDLGHFSIPFKHVQELANLGFKLDSFQAARLASASSAYREELTNYFPDLKLTSLNSDLVVFCFDTGVNDCQIEFRIEKGSEFLLKYSGSKLSVIKGRHYTENTGELLVKGLENIILDSVLKGEEIDPALSELYKAGKANDGEESLESRFGNTGSASRPGPDALGTMFKNLFG